MAISKEKMRGLLVRFAVVFPLPTSAHEDDFVSVWADALKDFDEKDVFSACRTVLLSCRNFPAIADVVDALRNSREAP